jgi:hypothetical protein
MAGTSFAAYDGHDLAHDVTATRDNPCSKNLQRAILQAKQTPMVTAMAQIFSCGSGNWAAFLAVPELGTFLLRNVVGAGFCGTPCRRRQ